VLAAGAAEGDQGVIGRGVAAAHRDGADGVGHALVGDGEEAGEELLGGRRGGAPRGGGSVHPRAHRLERRRRGLRHHRDAEALRVEPAEEEVDIGERQRPAAAVAGGARAGAGALRPDGERQAVEAADRAAAGRHRLDRQRRRDQVRVAHPVLEQVLEVAVPARHVGRGAAHVERDDRSSPERRAARAAPATPPAGPESSASLARKSARRTRPPALVIRWSVPPSSGSAAATPSR
jgi:hypothetical protein